MTQRTDYIYLLVIFLILLAGFIFSQGHIVSVYSDIGREFYIPWQMNEGQVLYKDILNVYSPLGYQLNAVLLKLGGGRLISLYLSGVVFSFLSLVGVYFITKIYTSRLWAFLVSLLVMFTCVFYQSISNYIVPYSYSVLYAMCAFLWSFLMLITYIKNADFKYYLISCLLMGLSISFKYEYALFILVIAAVGVYKKIGLKNFFNSLLAFVFVPCLSLFALLVQGAGLSDLVSAGKYILKLASAQSVKYFYTYAGFIPTKQAVMNSFQGVLNVVNGFTLISTASVNFLFMGYLTVLTLFVKRDKLQLLLNVTAILVSLKCIGAISLEMYGTFFLPLLFINIAALLYRIKYNGLVLTLLIYLVGLYAYIDYCDVKMNTSNIITTLKGEKIYTNNLYFTKRYNELVEYFSKNTTGTDSVLVLPEGSMLNYLTQRKSHNKYFYLIPPNVEIFTPNEISTNLKANPPSYIVVFYNMYPWYGTSSFPMSYGSDIQKIINKYYTVDEKISTQYDKIYKLKENL